MNLLFFQTGLLTGPTLLGSDLFVYSILPFILVFTVVFAVLQKSKILGDGKRQIDALVALVIGLIVISFAHATNIILSLMPFLAVSVVVILVFLILFAMVFQGKGKEFELHSGIQWVVGILVAIGIVVVVLISTGAWEYLKLHVFSGTGNSSVVINAVFLIAIAIAIVAAVWGKPKKSDK